MSETAEEERTRLELELPRRLAFLNELNALCLKHGAHISDTGLEYKAMVVLAPKRYALEDGGLEYVVASDP